MGKVNFTPSQAAAISNRGGALLVAASAGSGKTKVLVERLLARISGDSADSSINEFLVITYTKAAASELKGKIMDELASRIAEAPENRKLRRQLNMCCNADISTIHSFCGNIIRENSHILGIPSDFRVAEESESEIIRHTVLDKVLDERYDNIDDYPAFQMLADMMSAGRDDTKLADTVLETYDKLRSHPNPEKWADHQLKMYDTTEITDISQTMWGKFLLKKYKMTAEWWKSKIAKLLDTMSEYEDFTKAYGVSVTTTYDDLVRLCDALGESWDAALSCADVQFPKPKPIKGYDELKEVRNKCKAEVKKISDQLVSTSRELIEDISAVEPVIKALISLVLDFDKVYSSEKLRRGLVDYSDLEHIAVKLLIDAETGERTPLAERIANKYEEVMVDEYQDVNAVQELIFNAVSRNGNNIFMVGDVKQSIYRFRLADPTIFLQKYNTFAHAEDAAEGESRKIILANNFRSRDGVLSAVNYVFQNVMSAEFGEMDYTPKEYLYTGKEFPDNGEKEIELDVIDMASFSGDDEERPERIDVEANFVAKRIKELIESRMQVTDNDDKLRTVEYGDVAILLRSSKSKAGRYAAALEKLGIPVAINKGEAFFESVEINTMMSLLSVIDNPLQDIPLISVLRSPLYGFTADELVEIRLKKRDGYFYDSMLLAAADNDKCRKFIDELEMYREAATDMPSDKLIWHIYHTAGVIGIIGAMSGGEARVKNLRLLASCAGKFENAGYKGLFAFMLYMRQLMGKGENPVPETDEAAGNAVRIMSMHKSKGLEFPVVFLADLTKKFNMDDTRKQILIHPELGIGTKMRDIQRKIEYPTIARQAVAEKIAIETMSEELRVLYVAMTRAREKLIMVCSYANWEREYKRLGSENELPVAPQLLMNSRNSAEWIIRTAMGKEESGELRGEKKTVGEWSINLVKGENYLTATSEHNLTADDEENVIDAQLLAEIKRNMEFEYPDGTSENIPSKLTATELKGLMSDSELAEDAEYITPVIREIRARRPSFDKKKQLSATEKGTLIHSVLQHIELDKCDSRGSIEAEVQRIIGQGIIDPENGRYVDIDMLESFFSSSIGKRMMGAKNCKREFKFSILLPANEFYNCTSDDELLLQGMIDCFFEEDNEIVLLDFKTDNVSSQNLEERAALYAGQIKAYKRALEEITGKKVKEALLFFLRLGKIVNIEQFQEKSVAF